MVGFGFGPLGGKIGIMQSQKLYSVIAKFYDFGLWLIGYKGAAAYIIKKLPFEAGASIRALDAGSGTGLYSFAILNRLPNSKIVAFDINPDMASKMKKGFISKNLQERTKVFVADILKELPNDMPNDFDLVVTGGVLEYVNVEEAVANLSKHLPRGGYFLNSPVKNNIFGKLVGKWMGFIPCVQESLLAAFSKNGFELVRRIEIPWYYFPISLVKEAHLFKKI